MAGGILNGPILFGRAFTCESNVAYAGTLVRITGADTVDLARVTDVPIGFAYTNTVDIQTGAAQINEKVAIVPLVNGMVVEMPREVGSAQLTVGGWVMPGALGTVRPYAALAAAGSVRVIGQVMETTGAGAAAAGDMVRVYVTIRDEFDRA